MKELIEMEGLFAEWRPYVMKEADHFVEDGFICPEKWKAASQKILFILKETNDHKGSITKLINEVCTSGRKSGMWASPTFHNIGRWAYGLLNYPDSIGSYKLANSKRKSSIQYCSFINLKKTTGGRTATSEVEKNAEKYSNFLRKQIEIISPDIIVFGGTYNMVKTHVLPELVRVSTRIHTYRDIICINAFHPACTKKRSFMYDQVLLNYDTFVKARTT